MTYADTDGAGNVYHGYGGGGTPYESSSGYLNAAYGLDGPGSSAYVHYGNYSSYAYESYYGGIYEENTTQFAGGYSRNTEYSINDGSSSYEHEASFTDHNPPIYYGVYSYGGGAAGGGYEGSYGYGYGTGYGYGVTASYSSATFETSYADGVESVSSQSLKETAYASGLYTESLSSMSGEYQNGMEIPGSATSYSSTSYGYLAPYTS